MVSYSSKRAVVSKAPYELYMAFVDMRNFMQFLPEDKKEGLSWASQSESRSLKECRIRG